MFDIIFSLLRIFSTSSISSDGSKLTELSIKSFNLSNVMWTSIILAPNIAEVNGAIMSGQWFEYPLKFSILEKSKSSKEHGYLATQYSHLIFLFWYNPYNYVYQNYPYIILINNISN